MGRRKEIKVRIRMVSGISYEGYTEYDSIEEAEIISNQITIIGLLLEAKIKER